jgi:hypothetical protein
MTTAVEPRLDGEAPVELSPGHGPLGKAAGVLVRRHLLAALFFCATTLLMVFPVASNISGGTVGWEGDNLFCIRQFWWIKHAVLDLNRSPFFDPYSYYPEGYEVARSVMFPVSTFPAVPITALWGPVVAYNLTLLFTFVMMGLGTYFWVRRLTSSRSAALVAGTIAAFLPYRFAHLPGHLHMMSTQWIPWCLYAFERYRDDPRPRWGAVLGVAAALVALSDWYYAYSASILLPVYALLRARPWSEFWGRLEWWRGLGLAACISSLLVLPFALPYARLRAEGQLDRGIGELEFWSLNFYDFFLPNRLNPWWGDWVVRWFPQQASQWVERGVSLGYTAIALALVPLVFRRRGRAVAALAGVWLVSYSIALGPTLHSGDRQVRIPVPLVVSHGLDRAFSGVPSLDAVRAEMLEQQAIPIPLPSFFLYLFVPLTSGMRVMARVGVWTGVMTAALAGWGTLLVVQAMLRWRARPPGLRFVFLAIVLAAVLFESWSTMARISLSPRPVDHWLARQPGAVVVELPVDQALRPFQDYYKTVHRQATVFGPVGEAFFPDARAERSEVLKSFPSPESLAALRSWDVTHLLLTPVQIPDWPAFSAAVSATQGLYLEGTFGDVQVYRVGAAP